MMKWSKLMMLSAVMCVCAITVLKTADAQDTELEESVWDKTKDVASDVWEGTKEVGADMWDGTKRVSSDIWEGTKVVGSDIKDGISDDEEMMSSQKNEASGG
ncbi:MAG: hypothetical protein J6X42_02490 [Alphaproteobacteria bacterium]|nr:hypothetical protein [Alphaproteobacteria bacterium]